MFHQYYCSNVRVIVHLFLINGDCRKKCQMSCLKCHYDQKFLNRPLVWKKTISVRQQEAGGKSLWKIVKCLRMSDVSIFKRS